LISVMSIQPLKREVVQTGGGPEDLKEIGEIHASEKTQESAELPGAR